MHSQESGVNCTIQTVLIVGAGWVGRQIAARLATYGLDVQLLDRDPQVLEQAFSWLQRVANPPRTSENSATPRVSSGASPASSAMAENWLARVTAAGSLRELAQLQEQTQNQLGQSQFDLAIECIPEQLSLKKRVLRQLSETLPPPTIIASNSSYFVPTLLQPYVHSPERYAHVHFHVPVLNDSVADIVGCDRTDPAVLDRLEEMVRRIGLEPLRLRREHPGYVFNWMLQALLKSALELVALDVVDPQDVDKSWKTVTGMPLGPFGIMDQIGLDVIEQVLANARWAEDMEVPPEKLLAILQAYTRQGHLGTKTRQGFYEYDQDMPIH